MVQVTRRKGDGVGVDDGFCSWSGALLLGVLVLTRRVLGIICATQRLVHGTSSFSKRQNQHTKGNNIIIISSRHLSVNRKGRWGTTDDFAASFLHFSLFSTALWDLPNSKPVYSLMLSSHLFLCLPFFPLSLCLARWFWPDLMNARHDHTAAVCVSL